MINNSHEEDANGVCICLITGKIIGSVDFELVIDVSVDEFALSNINLSGSKVIAILFKKFIDGRSYSIAARLREKYPDITLHAIGDLNEELSYFLKRSGFNSMLISAKKETISDSAKMLKIIDPFKHHYQNGNDGSTGIF